MAFFEALLSLLTFAQGCTVLVFLCHRELVLDELPGDDSLVKLVEVAQQVICLDIRAQVGALAITTTAAASLRVGLGRLILHASTQLVLLPFLTKHLL